MRIIPDNEIQLTNKTDLLGTIIYSEALLDIIKEDQEHTKLTIGLFGGWGSGKSSILSTLIEKMKQEEFIVFTYDAWKYSGDALRRSLILEMKNNLKIKLPDELEQELNLFYGDKHEDIDHKICLKKSSWLNAIIFIPFLLFLVLFWDASGSTIFFVSLLSPFLAGLAYLITNSIFEYKISIKNLRFFSPEQFEKIFKKIVKKLLTDEKKKKLVIVVDNIDRCEEEVVKETLKTIKNFLECENCIYIIPIDEESVKNSLKNNIKEADEYLRKVFNVVLRIRDYSRDDFFYYTKELIKKYDLGFSDNVADLLSFEFSKNPRRIIQTLNNLIFELNIAKKQQKYNFIRNGTIDDMKVIDFLAKLQVIKEEWPALFKEIIFNPSLLNEIDESLKKGKEIKNVKMTEPQRIFFSKTININMKNPDPFIKIKDHDVNIPDYIFDYIKDGDVNKIFEVIEKEEVSKEKILDVILKTMQDVLVKKQLWDVSGFSLINLFLKLAIDDRFTKMVLLDFNRFKKFIDNSKLIGLINNLDRSSLIKFSKIIYDYGDDFLQKYILKYFNENIENDELFIEYLQSFHDKSEHLKGLDIYFRNKILLNGDKYLKFKDIINFSTAKYLISNNYIDDCISKINEKTDNITFEQIHWFNDMNLICDELQMDYLNKIYLCALNKTEPGVILFWLGKLRGHFKFSENDYLKSDKYLNIQMLLNKFFESWFYKRYSYNEKTEFSLKINKLLIDLFSEFYISSKGTKTDTLNKIDCYFIKSDDPVINDYVNNEIVNIFNKDKASIKILAQSIINIFINSTTSEMKKKIFILIVIMLRNSNGKEGLAEEQIKSIYSNLISKLVTNNNNSIERELVGIAVKERLFINLLIDKIRNLNDFNSNLSIVQYLDDLPNEELRKTVVCYIVINAGSYATTKKFIEVIKNQFKASAPYIRMGLVEKLSMTTTTKRQDYLDALQLTIEYQDLFAIVDTNHMSEVVDKLVAIIFSNDSDSDKIFSVKQLSNIEKLPKKKEKYVKDAIAKLDIEKLNLNIEVEKIEKKISKQRKQ